MRVVVVCVEATCCFYQFLVQQAYRDRFTVISHRGLKQSVVALMGFRNSLVHIQRYMYRVLRPFKEYCRAYIDDIVIFSDSESDHLQHLETIFQLFTDRRLSISPKKSWIAYPSVELLGFRVNALGCAT